MTQARLVQPEGYEVDLFGNAVLENDDGLCAQVSFGMDNAYQCQLEVWGSKATLIAPRIFTAGPELKPPMLLRTSTGEETVELDPDDSFLHSIQRFQTCTAECSCRHTADIFKQADTIALIQKKGDTYAGNRP